VRLPRHLAVVTAAAVLLPAGAAVADPTPWTTGTAGDVTPWTTSDERPTPAVQAEHTVLAVHTVQRRHRHVWWHATATCRPLDHGAWIVERGDTLTLVAACTGSTVAEVRRASGIAGDLIYPGERLWPGVR